MITIQNNRLEIQIQEPSSSYNRSRFDWGGICQQIRLDGVHTYCSQEATADEPGSEGIGLIDEFGIHTPIGYDQIEVGDWFPKIGVGFLQKTNPEPYDFFFDYEIRPVPIRVEKDDSRKVSFIQESGVINGWGWRLRKIYALDCPDMTIDYSLENTGEKHIATEQYNHNFVAINTQVVGPDYQLQTSFPIHFDRVYSGLQVEDHYLNLTEIPSPQIYALQSDGGGHQNATWDLVHIPSGRGISVEERFPLSKFALWGKSHVISPELFVWIDLPPGGTQNWGRKYTFY